MNTDTIKYLKQLQKGIFNDSDNVNEDPFMEELNEVCKELYKEPINLNDYREQNITKK